ncbi:SprT-like domain-containing protein [Staphylococcus hominis]|uniref:SprT-like domain-containing protein n=1 Tax=Staphylococcus hominis TaxID=1290 RepID=UPI003DA18CFF
MTNIKTIEYYNEFAKQFVQEMWGQELDIPVEFNNRKRIASGSFDVYTDKHDTQRKGHVKIDLVSKNLSSHEETIEVLKHELCHWYCYTNHLDFYDGDKDFENELSRVGASSTEFGYLNDKKTQFIQGMTKSNKLKKNGFSDAKYNKITCEKMFDLIKEYSPGILDTYSTPTSVDNAYEVYYKGQKLCYVFKYYGYWITLVENGKQDKYKYKTRKKALMPLIYQLESEPV